jgi:hypothetical protein
MADLGRVQLPLSPFEFTIRLNPFGPLVYKNFSGDFPNGDSLRTFEKGEVMIGFDGCGDGSCTHDSYKCRKVGPTKLQCSPGIVLSIKDDRLFFNGKPLGDQ